jgi:methionyl-tRNA synthetase
MSASSSDRFYLTTPIYYVSDVPHIGHAYTTIVGDSLARYERLRRGEKNVFYLTGTDEHGEKLERAAQAKGMSPQTFVDLIAEEYQKTWRLLDIRHDDFIRTTEPRHEKVVQHLWQTMAQNVGPDGPDIYLDRYEGLYCVGCENFLLEKDLLPGNLCPDHKRPVEKRSEESYFFRLSRYQQPLLDLYARCPDFISPPRRMNEVRTFVESGLRELSVSRSSFQWGVPVPSDPRHVIYVWIDALTNYYSALQDHPDKAAFWGSHDAPLAIHLVGKEIVRFHGVYWPAMLMSAGLPLPRKVLAHGWWTVDGEKMSKTLGNVVDPRTLADDLSASALRYFLLREIPLGEDGDFSYDALVQRYNSELANDLGNLLNRTLAMVEKFCEGRARRWSASASPEVRGERLQLRADSVRAQVEVAMAELQPQKALEAIFSLVREGNTYLEQAAPFTKVKSDPRGADHILYNVLELLRWLGLLLEPFMPERCLELRRQLGLSFPEVATWPSVWGELPDDTVVRKGATLFPRIDPDRQQELLGKWRAARRAAEQKAQAAAPPAVGQPAVASPAKSAEPAAAPTEVSIDDFQKLELRVAKVLSAERVPKKDRLLKVELDLGPLGKRQVVAGIAELTAPELLVGKSVVLLCNLKPAKIGGLLSSGMILALGDKQLLGLATSDREVPPGTALR